MFINCLEFIYKLQFVQTFGASLNILINVRLNEFFLNWQTFFRFLSGLKQVYKIFKINFKRNELTVILIIFFIFWFVIQFYILKLISRCLCFDEQIIY